MQTMACFNTTAATHPGFIAADSRADGNNRRVWVGRQCISIARRYIGIEMHVAVPTNTYLGVLLRAEANGDGERAVRLEHQDPDLSVTLWQETADVTAAEHAWQAWADYLRLPALRPSAGGETPSLALDELAAMPSSTRRRRGVSRRPRFLVRRKPGCPQPIDSISQRLELTSPE